MNFEMENRRGDWESDALPLNDREYKNANNIQKAFIWIEKWGFFLSGERQPKAMWS